MWIDKKTRQVRRLKIATAIETAPVEATVHYAALKSGLSYPARTVVKIVDNRIHMEIKTHDYEMKE